MRALKDKVVADSSREVLKFLFCAILLLLIPQLLSGMIDSIPQNTIKTVRIAGKTWTTENLNIEVPNSWCYKNDPENCKKYGRLYTWEAGIEACKKLGNGWRLPTDEDWQALAMATGGYTFRKKPIGNPEQSYQALIQGGDSGFDALLGGVRVDSIRYYNLGRHGSYWSATEQRKHFPWLYWFYSGRQRLVRFNDWEKIGLSCRCVRDD